jgi:hypothetical protein
MGLTRSANGIRTCLAATLGLCLVGPLPATAQVQPSPDAARSPAATQQKSFLPASIRAQPGLQCRLHPPGAAVTAGVPVYTDDDGYARFHALRMGAGEANRQLTLDCTDGAGARSSYPVDLASEETFAPRPADLAKERGTDRPPLKGDPLSYSQAELVRDGYGLRPDPAKDPKAYLTWLIAASSPARMLQAKRPDPHVHNVISLQAPQWAGSVLGGAANYVAVEGAFKVPTAVPGGDRTTNTEIAIWNGLGGFGTGSGLIQGGVSVATTTTAAGYGSWREYCCGDPNSNGYGGAFVPNPGDTIFAQNWYCDASGNLDIAGGYGCTFLHDLNTGAILSCTLANGSPCWSVQALPTCAASPTTPNCMTLGLNAEFIIENQSPQLNPPTTAFTDFTPTVRMTGSAYSSQSGRYSQTVGTDPTVYLLTDFTNTTTSLNVALGFADATCFTIYPAGTPVPTVRCNRFFPPPPRPSQIDPRRKDEIVALILYGVINDAGGLVLINGQLKPVPPRGPVTEILAALPPALAERVAPLVKDYPASAEAAEGLVERLNVEIGGFVRGQLARQQMP